MLTVPFIEWRDAALLKSSHDKTRNVAVNELVQNHFVDDPKPHARGIGLREQGHSMLRSRFLRKKCR